MKPWQRRALNGLTALVTASGVVYFWMKYLMESGDPFSVINHPLQPWMLDLHILASPFLILIFGIVLSAHILKKLNNPTPANRRSGLVSLVSFPVMVLSGYWLQIGTNPLLHQIALVAHIASGLVFAVFYIAHWVISLRILRLNRRSVRASQPET